MAAKKEATSAILAEAIDEALAEVVETKGGVDEVDIAGMFSAKKSLPAPKFRADPSAAFAALKKGGEKK